MLDLSKLKTGLNGTADLLVAVDHTAPRVGSGRVHVLATPVMINVIEAAALAAVEDLLPVGYQSLGIHLDIRHFAATPVGMRVRATAELDAIDDRLDLTLPVPPCRCQIPKPDEIDRDYHLRCGARADLRGITHTHRPCRATL